MFKVGWWRPLCGNVGLAVLIARGKPEQRSRQELFQSIWCEVAKMTSPGAITHPGSDAAIGFYRMD